MQVVKTAKYKKAAQHEQSAGDAVCHQGATISNDLLRIIQLIVRHWFAFTHFSHDRFGAAYFFADRDRCPVPQSLYEYRRKGGKYQRQREGKYGQKAK